MDRAVSKEGDPLGQRAADFLVGLKAKLKARLFRRRLTRSELESVARPLMRVTERVLAEKESFSQLMDGPWGGRKQNCPGDLENSVPA